VKSKLLVAADRGLLKAYRVERTPKGTRRLEPLEEVVLEEAHQRLVEKVTDLAGRHQNFSNNSSTLETSELGTNHER
jgi:hypothetical protein